jgi:hypothetical protein
VRCRDAARRVTDYAEGGLGPLAHWRMRRHLAGCDHCRSYAGQLQQTARALPRLAALPVAEVQVDATLAMFRQWHAQPGRAQVAVATPGRLASAPTALGLATVTALVAVIGVVFARHPAPIGAAWGWAAVLLALALGLMSFARRSGQLTAALAVAAAAVPAFAAGHGALALANGVDCILHELLSAAAPLAALVLWRRTEGVSRAALAGLAASAALAGDAALHISCSVADSALHLFVFHVGGVALAAALAGSLAGPILRLGRATA